MKTVVSNSEVPHLWAHQTQDHAKNATGSLFFDGDTIYSYGRHFPIAQHVTNSRGEKAVLLTTREYSVTTSRHVSEVRSSIPRGVPVFEVNPRNRWPVLEALPLAETVAGYNEQITQLELKASRAKDEWKRNRLLSWASKVRDKALQFVAFYDLSVPVAELRTDLEAIKAAAQAEVTRKAKETKQRKLDAEREYADSIEKWLRGERAQLPAGIDTLLRIEGDNVWTSRGASFPVSHAKRGLALIEAVMASGEEWKTNGHTCHLGNYQIDRITANGTVYAGCHIVPWKSIQQIREQLLAVEG
jgi:hypothetical protein